MGPELLGFHVNVAQHTVLSGKHGVGSRLGREEPGSVGELAELGGLAARELDFTVLKALQLQAV